MRIVFFNHGNVVAAYFSRSGLLEKTGVKNIHATSHRSILGGGGGDTER